MRSVPDPKDNRKLITEGVLTRVEYRANKGDGVKTYYHDFRGHKPLLCYGSDDGRLYVVEGSYKVTARGIVG